MGRRLVSKAGHNAYMKAWRARNPDKVKEQARKTYQRRKAAGKSSYRDNPARARAAELQRKYGLTPEGYDQMFADQAGLCAICRRPPGKRRLHVDHCHETGRVRGLLCHDCNTGLGKFQDSAAVLQAAIAYKETR